MSDFDPNRFVDRRTEQELFKTIVRCEDDSRVLAIKDDTGTGKSHLLQKLQRNCAQDGIPVALVGLSEISDRKPLSVVHAIVSRLEEYFGLSFHNFSEIETARAEGDLDRVLQWEAAHRDQSAVHLEGSTFEGAIRPTFAREVKQFDGPTEYHEAPKAPREPLKGANDAKARRVQVEAFFADVRQHSKDRPVVLLVDNYEVTSEHEDLANWFERSVLPRHFLDLEKRPPKLVMVVAGWDVPSFGWTKAEWVDASVLPHRLSFWEKVDLEECLQVHELEYTAEELDRYYTVFQETPPKLIVDWVQQKKWSQQRRSLQRAS